MFFLSDSFVQKEERDKERKREKEEENIKEQFK